MNLGVAIHKWSLIGSHDDQPPGITLKPMQVNRFAHKAIGGCSSAEFEILNPTPEDFWQYAYYLGNPLEFYAKDFGAADVWWGFISGITLNYGTLEIGASLDYMHNTVRVDYTYIEPGTEYVGEQKSTAWTSNTQSVNRYGNRELIQTSTVERESVAWGLRLVLLNALKDPTAQVRFGGAQARNTTLTIQCSGFWEYLFWEYFSRAAGYEANEEFEAVQDVGSTAAATKVEQEFDVPDAFACRVLKIHVNKVGSPLTICRWASKRTRAGARRGHG